jgi:hypothetical protein
MRHCPAATGLQRQSRLGAVERLNLALFVDRQHDGVLRWIEIEADDVDQLLGEGWVVRTLKLRARCGWNWCASQMRCTDRSEMLAALVIARPVQCVIPVGGSPQVSATTRATVSAGIGGLPGLRVLSRSRPSGPSSAKRCCQRQTIGRLTSTSVATCCTGRPSAEARTMRAHSTYLHG